MPLVKISDYNPLSVGDSNDDDLFLIESSGDSDGYNQTRAEVAARAPNTVAFFPFDDSDLPLAVADGEGEQVALQSPSTNGFYQTSDWFNSEDIYRIILPANGVYRVDFFVNVSEGTVGGEVSAGLSSADTPFGMDYPVMGYTQGTGKTITIQGWQRLDGSDGDEWGFRVFNDSGASINVTAGQIMLTKIA